MHRIVVKGIVLASVVGLSACATIVGGRYQQVSIQAPAGSSAAIVGSTCNVHNDKGSVNVTAPGNALVHRSSEPLNVHCVRNGQEVASGVYSAHLRGMFWGNIIFGGAIGMIVDLSDSAARHYPKELTLNQVQSSMASMPVVGGAPAMMAAATPGSSDAGTTDVAPQAGGPASLDPRVSVPMFRAAQDVASVAQCDRLVRVEQIDGDHGSFFSQCPAGRKVLHIECTASHCEPQG
ncbi:hypothetical protein [Pinirhizobacter soli]|uniref:hypothetical protein n=1 Tax=Pinirhizobacter soli TaxID=2786953 RepID=UPI002029C631|nr:hypothetical protein [Pinirhizobacter soli]